MTQTDDKNVKIQGAIGKPPTETFKVSATYMDGFKATCVSIINGGQAGAKAHAVANAILDRSRWFSVGICKYKPGINHMTCYNFKCSHWWKNSS